MWDIAAADKETVVAAANGSGKTEFLAAPLALWHAAIFEGSEVICTAGVYRQVKDLLFAAFRRYQVYLGPDWQITENEVRAPNGSVIRGFSTEDPYKFEGWHGGKEGYLFLILDEAKSISDGIYEATKRCNAKGKRRVLIMSSTGAIDNFFGQALTTKRHLYNVHTVTAYDCPHRKPSEIQELIDEYGREHHLVKSSIFSELLNDSDETYLIPRSEINICRASPPAYRPGTKYGFIDWAAGGDECVFAILDGNKVMLEAWRDPNTSASAARACAIIHKHKIPVGNVFADDGGMGIALRNVMHDLNCPVIPFNFGAPAVRTDSYVSRGAEIWDRAGIAIRKCEILLPDDEKLFVQLSTRKKKYKDNGKLALETKPEMRERGLTSPDRADAVCGVIGCCGQNYKKPVKSMLEMVKEETQEAEPEHYAGFWAG